MKIPIGDSYICLTLIAIYFITLIIWVKINCTHLMPWVTTNYSKIRWFIRWIWIRAKTFRINSRIIISWIILFNYCGCYFSYCRWLIYSLLQIHNILYYNIWTTTTSAKIPNKYKCYNNPCHYSCYWSTSKSTWLCCNHPRISWRVTRINCLLWYINILSTHRALLNVWVNKVWKFIRKSLLW